MSARAKFKLAQYSVFSLYLRTNVANLNMHRDGLMCFLMCLG